MSDARSQYGRPVYLPKNKDGPAAKLTRRRLKAKGTAGDFDQAWLQKLLVESPEFCPLATLMRHTLPPYRFAANRQPAQILLPSSASVSMDG